MLEDAAVRLLDVAWAAAQDPQREVHRRWRATSRGRSFEPIQSDMATFVVRYEDMEEAEERSYSLLGRHCGRDTKVSIPTWRVDESGVHILRVLRLMGVVHPILQEMKGDAETGEAEFSVQA
jgi:hypothetical protein